MHLNSDDDSLQNFSEKANLINFGARSPTLAITIHVVFRNEHLPSYEIVCFELLHLYVCLFIDISLSEANWRHRGSRNGRISAEIAAPPHRPNPGVLTTQPL